MNKLINLVKERQGILKREYEIKEETLAILAKKGMFEYIAISNWKRLEFTINWKKLDLVVTKFNQERIKKED